MRRIIAVAVLLGLMGIFGAFTIQSSNNIPEQGSHPPEQDDTKDTYDSPEDIVGFLSDEAVQKCLEYHIFENPNDWELNIFHLPLDEEKTKYISSNTFCMHLVDSYYIYAFLGSRDFHKNPILRLRITNTDTEESVAMRPEIFPDILDLLRDRGDGVSGDT